ncbi:outer membrane protein assembly factor BamE [Candidatus Tisiphia endosymbiont of Beris chalybata]|uniref:outer membrane protein assembly factor BamE n=1 Tax=Candidatus Tisiphia endosymbiont of Beris chalybata TaxID=3066262 RepID=UPI00312C7915
MKIFIIRILSTMFILLTLSNCQVIESRGQYVDDSLLPMLENKKLSKNEVEDLIGTATIIPSYSPNTWYYVHRSLSKRAWLEPKVLEQRIIKVSFNKNDTIDEALVLNNSYKNDINIVKEYTKTYGTELNSVQKFVRNIGRFNQTTESKKKKRK